MILMLLQLLSFDLACQDQIDSATCGFTVQCLAVALRIYQAGRVIQLQTGPL